MPRLIVDGSRAKRFESDVETLPFPEGGVFGESAPAHEGDETGDIVMELTRSMERMQRQIDALRRGVDSLVMPKPAPVAWRPPAA